MLSVSYMVFFSLFPYMLKWQRRSLNLFYQNSSYLLNVLSHFNHVQLFVTLWTVAHQAPVSMGFSSHEYWSGLPCPSPGIFLTPKSELYLFCLLHWQVSALPPVIPFPKVIPLNIITMREWVSTYESEGQIFSQ